MLFISIQRNVSSTWLLPHGVVRSCSQFQRGVKIKHETCTHDQLKYWLQYSSTTTTTSVATVMEIMSWRSSRRICTSKPSSSPWRGRTVRPGSWAATHGPVPGRATISKRYWRWYDAKMIKNKMVMRKLFHTKPTSQWRCIVTSTLKNRL